MDCNDIQKGVEGSYPITVANLYAEVLVMLCDDILRLSSQKIALAGILVEKEHLVQEAYAPHCSLLRRKVEGDWVSLWFEKNRWCRYEKILPSTSAFHRSKDYFE